MNATPLLTPSQCRQARVALGWSMRALSRASMVAPGTAARIERGGYTNLRTLDDIKRAFAKAGIRFSPTGLKIKKE
jgi:transcriptional regulator with XRE-family HTH domain